MLFKRIFAIGYACTTVLHGFLNDQNGRTERKGGNEQKDPGGAGPEPGVGIPSTPAAETLNTQICLEQLYPILTRLLEEPDSVAPFGALLAKLESLIAARSSAIFVVEENSDRLVPLVTTFSSDHAEALKEKSLAADSQGEGRRGDGRVLLGQSAEEDGRIESIPIRKGLEDYGILIFKLPPGAKLSDSDLSLLHTLGKHLAPIICSTRRAQLNRRLALYEERSVIARELHDSLGQSLSYLNLQISRLQSLQKGAKDSSQLDLPVIETVIQNLRNTITSSNHQLRGIITTFRITMKGRSFAQALDDSVDELAKRSGVVFDLDNRLPCGALSVIEEMHVLQITREALSNVIRHSHAKHAWIVLQIADGQTIRLTIDDDGTHTKPSSRQGEHHGLVIMQERAHKIGGAFSVEKLPNGGTRVLLTFVSANQAKVHNPSDTSN